jgi:hypothetical protein
LAEVAMFGGSNRKNPETGPKIRLPRAPQAPVITDLQFLFGHARENRGKEVELTWHDPLLGKTFSLSCLFRPPALDAIWTIWEDSGNSSKLTWQYETSDFALVNDVINMLDKKMDGTSTQNNTPIEVQASPSNPMRASQTNIPISAGYVPPFSPAARNESSQSASLSPSQSNRSNPLEGDLSDMPMPQILQAMAMNQATGKLEVVGDDATGDIYFERGIPTHAATPAEYGDDAIRELVAWEKGSYKFHTNQTTTMRSVEKRLPNIVAEGIQLLDQKRLLKQNGLTYESYLIRKHKGLSETEFKLMLTKGAPLDYGLQKDIYDYLGHKRTLTDLLRDKPMETPLWSALVYNFLSCGLIEVRQPDAVQGSALDFLGEAKGQVQTLHSSFIRPESGIYSPEALLYFLQYEYYRYEAYNFPISLIIFEMMRKRQETTMEVFDRLPSQAASIAAMRIELVKRPLDTLGHFESLDYAIVLPNTKSSSAAFVANRMYEALTATPLYPGIDRSNIALAFGIASLPADGDDLQSLVNAAKDAKYRAKQGAFPIVLARTARRD